MVKQLIVLLVIFFGIPSVWGQDSPSPSGIQKEFYPDGSLKIEKMVDSNTGISIVKEYYKRGRLKSEGRYVNNALEGPFREYYFNQKLHFEINYHNGAAQGLYREYYDSGTLKVEGSYEGGKRQGPYKFYDEKQRILEEFSYDNDVPEGTGKSFYADGNVQEEFSYKAGKYDGQLREYYPNGNLKFLVNYVADKRQGAYQLFYEGGGLWENGFFLDDKIEGISRTMSPSGIIKNEAEYHNDILDGMRRQFWPNGILQYQDTFVDDKLVKRLSFSKQGELIRESSGIFKFFHLPKLMPAHYFFMTLFSLFSMLVVGFTFHIFYSQKYSSYLMSSAGNGSAHRLIKNANRSRELNLLDPQSEKMYRHVIETVDSGIFLAEPKGKIFYVNHAFVKQLGFLKKEEVVGFSISEELFRNNYEGVDFLERLRKSQQVSDYKFRYHRADGTDVILAANANYIWNDRGEVIGIEGVIFDITEKTLLQEDLLLEKKKLERLVEFFERIDSFRKVETLAAFVVLGVREILEAEKCSLMLQEKGSGELYIVGSEGLPEEIVKTTRLSLGDPIAGIVAQNHEPLFVKNIEYDDRFSHLKRPQYLGRSFLIAPLVIDEKFVGLINVTDKRSEITRQEPFRDVDLRVLLAIAGKVAIAIDNIELFNELNILAVTDPMTQIYNYRLLSDSLDHEINRKKRVEGNLCVILMDIDNFKTYNDTFGHLEGDELLKQLGRILKADLRESDIVCRYAGDEFCIVLPDTDIAGARFAAEKIRKTVEQTQFRRPVTVSIGIASYKPGMTKKDILIHADTALYQAKHEGRNRVIALEV